MLICDIEGRGWCVPSGRVEPFETSCQAAIREAREEGGAIVCGAQYLGCYRISERSEVRWADVFAGRLVDLIPIGDVAESKGRRMVKLEELEKVYHLWSPLMDAIFAHSKEVLDRHEQAYGRPSVDTLAGALDPPTSMVSASSPRPTFNDGDA